MHDNNNVIIVGAGIVGLCTALALQEQGKKVTLIEPGEPGQATSFGNAGVISPWSCVPIGMPGLWKSIPGMLLKKDAPASVPTKHLIQYLPWFRRFLAQSSPENAAANAQAMHLLSADSSTLYKMLLSGTGHENLVQNSVQIHVFRDAAKANEHALGYQLRKDLGAQIDKISTSELRKLEPALSHDYQAAIVIRGTSRTINPGKIGQVLATKIRQQGGRFIQSKVQSLAKTEHGWSVQIDGESLHSHKVVVAAGVWSANLLEPLGIKIPLAVERGYHVSFPDTKVQVKHSVMDVHGHVIGSSMETGVRVAGIAEFAGIDTPENPARIETVRKLAIAMFPDLQGEHTEHWMGRRPSFPDSLPLIEEFPGHTGLFAAFGHSHFGLLMAPKTGRIVADLVSGTAHNIDLSVFGSQRFN